MTQPRRIVPGATYLLTRRCYQRTFRLRPSALTTQVYLYCLGLACAKTGVSIHAVCVMSNHEHLVVTDPQARLPDFLRELHRAVAKSLNAAQGQSENLWSAEKCDVLQLAEERAVVDAIAYVAANPVTAGLVEQPDAWPGVNLWQPAVLTVPRPAVYFGDDSSSPARVSVRITNPRLFDLTDGDWSRRIGLALKQIVLDARAKIREAGREFIGKAGVLAQSFTKRARSIEPRRLSIPKVAARDSSAQLAVASVLKGFRQAYRSALSAWRDGARNVEFPFGTWWLVQHHRANVAAAPA